MSDECWVAHAQYPYTHTHGANMPPNGESLCNVYVYFHHPMNVGWLAHTICIHTRIERICYPIAGRFLITCIFPSPDECWVAHAQYPYTYTHIANIPRNSESLFNVYVYFHHSTPDECWVTRAH